MNKGAGEWVGYCIFFKYYWIDPSSQKIFHPLSVYTNKNQFCKSKVKPKKTKKQREEEAAAAAVLEKKKKSGGFLSKVFGGASSSSSSGERPESPTALPATAFSLADYHWALAVVSSRALTFRGKKILAPICDMFNYQPHPNQRQVCCRGCCCCCCCCCCCRGCVVVCIKELGVEAVM